MLSKRKFNIILIHSHPTGGITILIYLLYTFHVIGPKHVHHLAHTKMVILNNNNNTTTTTKATKDSVASTMATRAIATPVPPHRFQFNSCATFNANWQQQKYYTPTTCVCCLNVRIGQLELRLQGPLCIMYTNKMRTIHTN